MTLNPFFSGERGIALFAMVGEPKMTRNLYKLTSHLLPLIAFLFIANVGKGAEVEAWTKALIARAEQGEAEAQSTARKIVGIPRAKQHENQRVLRRDWTSAFQAQYSTSLRSVADCAFHYDVQRRTAEGQELDPQSRMK